MNGPMKLTKPFIAALLFALSLSGVVNAESCKVINNFEGLVFDAGAYPALDGMVERLDFALSKGVEKVVLFPHPIASKGNDPEALEEVFPDLVVQGLNPWSDAAGVIWPEPLSSNGLAELQAKLVNFPDQKILLSHISRFENDALLKLVKAHKNLWLGLSDVEVKILLQTCANGDIRELMSQAQGRLVFASFGLGDAWKNYKWQIARLKKLATLLPKTDGEALVFRNAEELYGLSVTAP